MKTTFKTVLAMTSLAFAAHAAAQVTFYENENFAGRVFTTDRRVQDAQGTPFNDRARSVVVVGRRWEACEDAGFRGRCVVLRPGQYPSMQAMGLQDRVTSVRPIRAEERIDDSAYAPMPVVAQDFRRRDRERLFDAEVTSARAVVAQAAQRCWIEREQVTQQPGVLQNANLPGAAVGAVIGGILGHQVGGGSGKQIATVGGALGGAALGSQYGGAPVQPLTQDVRRCDGNPAQATPAYWDVVYQFRGQEHRVQMATPPGRTIVVNNRGEPRA